MTIDVDVGFEPFVASFEETLGKFDQAKSVALSEQPRQMADAIKDMEGDQGLMIFFSLDHGKALRMVGQSRKAIRFILGNPLVAVQMTRHDIRAGEYVPLTVLVHEVGDGRVRIEYGQPSSLLAVCDSAEIEQIARDLDRKLLLVVEHAAERAVGQG